MIAYIVFILALLGLVLYVLPLNGKIQEIGRIMFMCGLLVTMFALGGKVVKLF